MMKWLILAALLVTPAYGQMIVRRGAIAAAAVCGDGVRNGSEQCDGSDLNSATCVTQGFASGTLSCSGACTYDTSSCVAHVAPVGVGTPVTVLDSDNGTSSAVSATVVSGSNRLLVVGVYYTNHGSGSRSVSGVTFGATSMTQLNCLDMGGGDHDRGVCIYYLVAPTVTTATVTATYSGTMLTAIVGAAEYTGVNQATPFGTPTAATGTGTPATASVTSTANNLVIDMVAPVQNETITAAAGQTSRFNATTGSGSFGTLAHSTKTSGGSVTTSWTLPDGGFWGILVVEMDAV